jgi:MFS family permease
MARALFTAAATMNAAMAVASPAATLVAAEHLGPAWGSVPNTAAIIGTGAGALVLARMVSRRGWRHGLRIAFATGAAGGLLAAVSQNAVLLSVALLLLGFGNAGALLSRYAAAEMYPPQRRGYAIGLLVWAGAAGAVGGPLLLGPVSALTVRPWTALFLLAALTAALAAVAASTLPRVPAGPPPARVNGLLRTPAARTALVVMGTAQVVMVAVMTAAPLDMHLHHHGLGAIGAVLAAHTLGMFALAPLTGWLVDRAGARVVMAAGLLVVAGGPVLAVFGPQVAGFFLLGYGWNLCLIGGSAALAAGVPEHLRTRAEGTVDAVVWVAAAASGLASTGLLTIGGYGLLAALAVVAIGPAGLAVVRLEERTPASRR